MNWILGSYMTVNALSRQEYKNFSRYTNISLVNRHW